MNTQDFQTAVNNFPIFAILKNGKTIFEGMTKEQALDKFFPTIEDRSTGYIFDNEANTIYSEVDGKVVAKHGDTYVDAGDDVFEIEPIGTFDVRFDNDEISDCKNWARPADECLAYIDNNNGTNHSYFADYKGGTVSIVCNESDEVIYSTEVN